MSGSVFAPSRNGASAIYVPSGATNVSVVNPGGTGDMNF